MKFYIAPEWARSKEVHALFGLPKNQLVQLVMDGKVIAKKTDPTNWKSATIFRVADIRIAIEGMADYVEWAKKHKEESEEEEE